MAFERRVLQAREVRALRTTDGKKRVRGYAATYGRTADLGSFLERIAPGAFRRIMRTKPDVVCVLNHSENHVLGRTTSGTLQLRDDDKGLYFECELPDTQTGRDTYESVQRGDLNGCSFAFTVDNERMCEYTNERHDPDFDEDEEGTEPIRSKPQSFSYSLVRTIRDFASLIDVSVVTHPAYPGTSVDARNLVAAECRSRVDDWRKNEIERLMKLAAECRKEERRLAVRDAGIRNRRLAILDLL